tara:strand:+ start:2278 stop:2970 length:693 start_codon:yes stop_codon:yes gene_type:complete
VSTETILIIEDEQALVDILKYNLTREGYTVFAATDGANGLALAKQIIPDLIILDVMIAPIDGFEICRELRTSPETEHVLIMMLTARGDELDEIVGFKMGADQYVVKPFKLQPLIQRIKAILRRSVGQVPERDVVESSGIVIDRNTFTATMHGEPIVLTVTELRLLWFIMNSPNRVFSRLELLEAGRGEDACSTERTIDVHIKSLRSKLGESHTAIQTVRGIGYRFVPIDD